MPAPTDHSLFSDPRKRAYLNSEGADKPLRSPVSHEVLVRARARRKARVIEQLVKHDCAAMLMYDPCNIRYALDTNGMAIFMMHEPAHYALVCADGYTIEFAYKGSEHVSKGIEIIDEVRPTRTWYYMTAGYRAAERVELWADELADILRQRGRGNTRLAVDKLEWMGVEALRKRGFTLVEGQELMQHARVVKGPDELELMKWSVRVCEAGLARLYEHSLPGATEAELWAHLSYENARSGGEWFETRLLTVGERTNPWYQEASDHVAQEGDLLSLDTDQVGPYGYCADLSRSWTVGHTRMNDQQREYYRVALDQIEHNCGVLRAGMTFSEFNERSWRIPERYLARKYSLALHGVGFADEWPSIPLHPDFARAYDGVFEDGMVVCVESLVGEPHGRECVKLETQVVIRPGGIERLDTFPWEDV